jgi:hypothetical protein
METETWLWIVIFVLLSPLIMTIGIIIYDIIYDFLISRK